MPRENNSPELTEEQLQQVDSVHNVCYATVCTLSGQVVPWNIEWIGELADKIQDIICGQLRLKTEEEFYPSVKE
jgi:hypothetical protein